MNISQPMSDLFQRIDSNRDGVNLRELQGLNKAAGSGGDGDNFHLSAEEGAAAGITDTQDLEILNQALGRAKTHNMDLGDVLFPSAGQTPRTPMGSPFAQSLASELNRGATNNDNPDVNLRLQRLEASFQSGRVQGMTGNYSLVGRDNTVSGVNMTDLNGVSDFASIRASARSSLASSMGGTPTDAQVDAYLSANFDKIAAQLGDDLNGRYNGLVKFTGDANGITAFQTPGPDDIVVCTDIQASITAFRQAHGQEAYIVSTSDNDSAHVFSVFKDKGTWNIQNYGTVVRTDAKDLRELYDKYMPNQRNIRLFSVDDKGGIHQERKVQTATGWREWDFRNNLGAGNYDPTTARQGVNVASNNLGVTYGNFNFNFNPQNTTMGLNYHTQSNDGNTRQVQGVGIEAQDHTNEAGFRVRRLDAKVERRTTDVEQHSPGHVSQTQTHLNLHAGVEQTPGSPIYWQDASDPSTAVGGEDTAVRFGAMWRRNSTHLLGQNPLRLELGHSQALGGTGTLSVTPQESSDIYQLYSGRMYNDLTAEVRGNIGAVYTPRPDLMLRAGVTPGLNFANIDGFKSFGQQAGNVAELHAYGEARWTPGRWTLAAMANADLRNPGVFQVGAVAEYGLSDRLRWATQVSHSNDPLLGNRTGVRSDLMFSPRSNVALSAGTGWAMDQAPMFNAGLRIGFDETGTVKRRDK